MLAKLGYSEGVAAKTFYEYVKSLRKLGIPFGHHTMKSQDKTLADYTYCDVMELAMTLALRVYHVVPDSVLKAIMRNRAQLHRLYRRAYAERRSGKGSPIFLTGEHGAPIELRGRFPISASDFPVANLPVSGRFGCFRPRGPWRCVRDECYACRPPSR